MSQFYLWRRGSIFIGFVHRISDMEYRTLFPLYYITYNESPCFILFFRHYFGDDMTTDSLVNGFPPPPLPEDEEQPELLQVKKIYFFML